MGMAYSIRCGIDYYKNAKAWVINLADMPYVKTETILNISNNINAQNIVCPYYLEKRGNPIGFGKKLEAKFNYFRG